MKIFSGIFGLAVLILVLCFALSNRQEVGVALWPFDGALQSPLYLLTLAPLLFGLFVGILGGWLAAVPHRLRARRLHKELGALTDKIDTLQKSSLIGAKPPLWRRKW